MLTTEQAEVFYERADASMLAKAPAIIPSRSWQPNNDWEEMRNYLEQVLLGLRNWRTPWWMHWGQIAANILPRRYFWLITPNNMTRGLPINQDVVDSTPTQALTVCAAGMMDGLSSPTKKWVKFKPAMKGFQLDTQGRKWFDDFEQRFYDVLSGSNYYDCKHQMYEDEIAFGTAPMLIYEHREKIIHCENPCAGEYYLGRGYDGNLVFNREFTQTARQMMHRFGPDALKGTDAGQLWNTKGGNLETEEIVGHSIEPNYPANQYGQKPNLGVVPGGYKYREYYWIRGKTSPQPLSVRGFHELPLMAPLWNTRGNDAYGRGCPGMDALPDVLQLHRMVRRLNEAIEKMVRPPMLADATMKNEPSSSLPGRVTYVPNLGKDTGMRPSYTVNPQVEHLEKVIENLERKIERWFHNDTFLMFDQMEGIQPRNELEISERKGEKLLRLGPVIERNLKEDAQGINRIVSIMGRRGLIPPKPQSLRGVPIQIDFVSKLAQIQRAASTAGMERTLAMGGRMEAAMPGTLDNFNKDKFIRDYGDKLDFPADDWSTEQEMKQLRGQRAQQMQEANQAHAAEKVTPALAQAAQNLSQTDTGGGISALQMLTGGVGGQQGAPQ